MTLFVVILVSGVEVVLFVAVAVAVAVVIPHSFHLLICVTVNTIDELAGAVKELKSKLK